ncbi:MAG TPA: TIGR04255 family protein [Candidatus Sulfotelmatobacter sp.]|nr:TIGR04255 family protein [Candidatus Sulfotelmatobacter sp.]
MTEPMTTKPVPMPSYENPPVNEVICGIMFKPITALLAPHLGLLWNKFRTEYPTCREAEPLIPVVESFDGEETGQVDLSVPFLPRMWFVSKDENAVIQVQRDRILHNWRKVRTTDSYPRYSVVKERFTKQCSDFATFLAENELGTIQPLQFEMTYLNHIPAESGWHTVGDIGKIFPDFNWRSGDRFLARPEKVNWRTSFALPESKGRLHISIQLALRRQDRLPLFVVDLTVRGMGADRTLSGMWPWFDTAREWIVRGFTDITGPELQRNVWRRTA